MWGKDGINIEHVHCTLYRYFLSHGCWCLGNITLVIIIATLSINTLVIIISTLSINTLVIIINSLSIYTLVIITATLSIYTLVIIIATLSIYTLVIIISTLSIYTLVIIIASYIIHKHAVHENVAVPLLHNNKNKNNNHLISHRRGLPVIKKICV
jgi:hypothetical protein